MSTRIDFYLLTQPNETARYQMACRLANKAYRNQHRIYIHTNSTQQAREFDALLWTFADDTFVPHQLVDNHADSQCPIHIGCEAAPEFHQDILINLADTVPEYYSRFARVLEIATNDPSARDIARNNYKMYKSADCELTTHEI